MKSIAPVAILLSLLACRREAQPSATDTMATSTTQTATSGTTSTTSTGSSGGTISSLNAGDRDFVMNAARGGMSEVSLGRMASENGVSNEVRTFGNRMVADHSKANQELAELARNKGLSAPTDVNHEQKKTADELSKQSGADFDKAYASAMVKDHQEDVAEFQKMSSQAQDPDLRAWINKTLPTLQDHLAMAKQMEAKVRKGATP